MEMVLTTLGVGLLTALFIRGHLRRHPPPAVCLPARQCPRCRADAGDASVCPRCGVPLQVYEVVSAPVAASEAGGALHAIVRADMCVGCATCAAACPVPGAVTVKNRLATVDPELCEGHGQCAQACPVGAIALSAGASVQRVEVPDLGLDFQTSVPGIYIVGELGGRGLIKNAVNEGKLAVEHVAESLRRRNPPPNADQWFDVAIVGSGPAGLSAALEACRLGLRYVVLEQGSLADTVRKYPRHKLLFAEPLSLPIYGDLWIADASKESLLKVWETIVSRAGLEIRTGHRVEDITPIPGGLRVVAGEQNCQARAVVLAMGRRGTPRRLGVPGEELEKVLYDVAEMEEFAGRRVLVVGGGDSAIETALGIANQPRATVHLSYRGDDFARAKERNREKLAAQVERGRITLVLRSQVREIRADVAVLEQDGQTLILPNDEVVIRIGGDAPYAFLQRLGIRVVQKDVPLSEPQARAG
jgi:thioredoxin reductase/NAD-dependent dihydropyrimidine dehydrogenase PreA subunit